MGTWLVSAAFAAGLVSAAKAEIATLNPSAPIIT